MYGLEYLLFFGVPVNKLELIDGRSRWAFPFASRESAEAHFQSWLETLCRWKQVDLAPAIHKSAEVWKTIVSGLCMELFPRPINLTIPIAFKAFDAFYGTFHRRDFWPGQPQGLETGWDSPFDFGDIRMNLWRLFSDLGRRHGGKNSSRVDIALSDIAGVAPDAYYFRKGRSNIMIERDYFCAPPDVIAEIMSAPSRSINRGPRMELYRRIGVPHLWFVEPANETVEVYILQDHYELQGCFRSDDSFACDLFPGELIGVKELFETQSKRWEKDETPEEPPEPIPEWLLPPDFKVGLEYFFHLGHPERRWEFWNNKAHSVLAFGSAAEARARLDHFVTEACRWEGMPTPRITSPTEDVDQTEIGRFQLTRQGRLVFLDVAVNGRLYKDLLQIWAKREAWDWGEENLE